MTDHYNSAGLWWSDLSGWLWAFTGSSVCVALAELGGDIFSWSTALLCKKKKLHPRVSDFRQNPHFKPDSKIQIVSVELDLIQISFLFLFLFHPTSQKAYYINQALSKARGSHFLLDCRLSTLALSQFQSMDLRAQFLLKHAENVSSPVRFCTGTSRGRAFQKVIDSSDFLLFPLWHKSGPEKGGVLVQRTTLDPKKYSLCGRKSETKTKKTQSAG